MAEDEDLEVLGAAVPVRSTTTDEQTDEGADGEVDEIPHRPIVPGDPSANRVSDPHGLSGTFRFEARGLIDVKGKGPIPTYFLIDRVSPAAVGM
jgi:hypothetical protein